MKKVLCPNDGTVLGNEADDWECKRCPTCNSLIFRE